ncbi:MAG: MFS transporter, partial [Stenotrophomonas sp.]|nr:MFS transporter [Stenotrophomonas sp.]
MSSITPPPFGAALATPARSATAKEWGAVLALSLGAFALVASEFMPVSLLTPIAADLRVTEGQAGQAIAVSGAFALVTSLLVSPLAGQLDRKWLLLGLTAAMIVSGTLAALAPSFLVFMVGRSLIGVAIGGFWAMSAATAMRLVPSHQVPRALAIVNGGNALATVIA